MTTDGAPTAAAMCAMPLSLPTNNRARAARAVTSGRVRSAKTIRGEALLRCNSSAICLSAGAIIATTGTPRLAKCSTTRANFSVAHCLVANAAAGWISANGVASKSAVCNRAATPAVACLVTASCVGGRSVTGRPVQPSNASCCSTECVLSLPQSKDAEGAR